MSRIRFTRRLPAAFTAAGLALAVAACGGESSTSSEGPAAAAADQLKPNADLSQQSLQITVWDGYTPKELPEKVKAKLKVKDMKVALHDTNEVAMTKLTAPGDSGIDVAFVSGQYAQALNAAGLLEPIHPELIPNLANLYPEATQLSYDKGNKYSVPYTWGTTGICYRKDLVKKVPDSWNDLLKPPAWADKKVTMMTTERWLALPAIKALGYSVNTDKDDEIAKVKDLLAAQKPHLLGYDDTTFGDKLTSGEAVMVEAWDGWCPTTDPKGNIGFANPKEGSDLWVDTMVIMKSSKNKEAAHALINYILDPEIHSWAAENINYKVPNKAAMERVSIPKGSLLDIKPAELLNGESIIDLGQASTKYTRLSTEITAQQ
ncbi:spermidine/putrescine ABC transporter substrate-binding protein [Nonomuraea angiospora]|uniref:Spermidine/putrescine transport system substrate-binding protein n=1 Tax=Nonomuraea angiospora TaxID=46172 RepID=A0ABR9MEG5_9ACTN|nr:spermidine/putrescine ABC transporter substrate-binding protein [Nonomuraea angiospora]MBE1590892.1 spermidine/putrescine transport system substrate-binding protein [Nonomuraea angiospora]MDX3107416.1 spermidine/putrescine ABC transporter substrate-binding protein [Nonomuraea angiospora]